MTDTECIAKLSAQMTEALKLHEMQATLIRLLRAQMSRERIAFETVISRQQADIDALVTERIEREFVCRELDKRVVELNAVIEGHWQRVKAELPKGV